MIIPYNQLDIRVKLRPRIFESTVIQQEALLTEINIVQNIYTKVTHVHMQVRVIPYADNNGEFGAEIGDSVIRHRDFTLVADNNCLVDIQAGGKPYLVRYPSLPNEEAWDEAAADSEKQLMYQGDFFQMLMHTQPVYIAQMARDFIIDADTPEVNKFQ